MVMMVMVMMMAVRVVMVMMVMVMMVMMTIIMALSICPPLTSTPVARVRTMFQLKQALWMGSPSWAVIGHLAGKGAGSREAQ